MRKWLLVGILFLCFSGLISGQEVEGITPSEAFELVKETETYLVDVRTIAEYVYVGHPENAYCLPLLFWDEKKQTEVPNQNFLRDLSSKFEKEDRLVFICRSGNRSRAAAQMALGAGFRKVSHVVEGFEGGKDEKGYRTEGGWKNRGLRYTYEMKQDFVYKKSGAAKLLPGFLEKDGTDDDSACEHQSARFSHSVDAEDFL
jgi:rhodanese-related sulfurtransferase